VNGKQLQNVKNRGLEDFSYWENWS